MKLFLTSFYDQHSGLVLTVVLLIAAVAGGLLAYDPALHTPSEQAAVETPLPTSPPATAASIQVPTPQPGATTQPEFGTFISPFNMRLLSEPSGFAGDPMVDADGNLVLAVNSGSLLSLDSGGEERWRVDLPAAPAGSPILTAAGEIAVVDRTGRLAAYDTDGTEVWAYLPEEDVAGVSGAARGMDGTLYYMLEVGSGGQIQAVDPGGAARWRAPVASEAFRVPPWIHPDGGLVFLKSEAFDAATGAAVPVEFQIPANELLTGADGLAYLRSGPTIVHWTLTEGAAVVPDDAPRFTIPDPGASFSQAEIDSNGLSWISYIGQDSDGIAWYKPDGSIANISTSASVLIGNALASDSAGVVYACGHSPRTAPAERLNQRTLVCMAFVPGEEGPHWSEQLAPSPEWISGFQRSGNEVYITTDEGNLYVLGRSAAVAEEGSSTAGFTGATPIENGWTWQAPEPLIDMPRLMTDGKVGFIAETGNIYYLNADGSPAWLQRLADFNDTPADDLQYTFLFEDGTALYVAYESAFAIHPEGGLLWEFDIDIEPLDPRWNFLQSGDVYYLLDWANTVYAFTPQGGLLWKQAFETGFRDDSIFPALSETGQIYLADREGTLYAFDRSGLTWTFDPGGNLRAASDPAIGPDGNIYYVVTSGYAGTLISLASDGSERWRTVLNTLQFYERPEFANAGNYARVHEDFIDLETGTIIPIEFPFDVTRFISGDDGFEYAIVTGHIIRWQIGPDGFEQLADYPIILEGFNALMRSFIRIYPSGFIELQVFAGPGIQLIWIEPTTGTITEYQESFSDIRFSTAEDEPEYLHCDQDLDLGELICSKNVPKSQEPIWSITIQGIEGNLAGFPPPVVYDGSRLYLLAGGQNVYVLEMEIP